MTRNKFIAGGACAASFVVGAFVGYQVAKQRLEEFYDERASREIGEADEYFKNLYEKSAELQEEASVPEEQKTETPEPPQSILLGDAVEALTDYQGRVPEQKLFYHGIPSKTASVPAIKVGNDGIPAPAKPVEVDEPPEPSGEYDEGLIEEARRAAEIDALGDQEREQDPNRPYVISSLAFLQNEDSHEQSNMMYYAGDAVLAYDNDTMVDESEVDGLVGLVNLHKFGGISEDSEIVFVRNERLQMDFEIIRIDGRYAKVVLDLNDDEGGSG